MTCVLAMEDASETTPQLQFNNKLYMSLGCEPWLLVQRAFDRLFPSSSQPWSLTSTELAMHHFLSADQYQQWFLMNSKQRYSADWGFGDCSWSGSLLLFISNFISLLASEGADQCRHLFQVILYLQETMYQVLRSGQTIGSTDGRDKCAAFEEISCHLKFSVIQNGHFDE